VEDPPSNESESELSSHCSLVEESRFREWLQEDLQACMNDLRQLTLELAEFGREELCQAVELIETTLALIKHNAPNLDRSE